MSEDPHIDDQEPVYIAVCEADLAKSPRELYKSIKEVSKFVNSPEGKSYGARFKKFGTPREALNFLDSGLSLTPKRSENAPATPINEPTSPFSSVTRYQLTEFKKYVDKGDMDGFLRLVESNPRYLVNTGGDVASILMEGFRYNALHIAAKSGQAKIVRKLLDLIHDTEFLTRLYGTGVEDVLLRQTNLLYSYLNTPDKGKGDTPLHFAANFGKVEVVRELVKEAALNRDLRNNDGKTALDLKCLRYNEPDIKDVQKEIELAITGFYVILSRNSDDSAIIVVTRNVSTNLRVCAVAGPFSSEKEAEEFRTKWMVVGKELKRSDFEKGYERVGRILSEESKVGWRESWRFLDDPNLIDLTNEGDLMKIDEFLAKRRRQDVADSTINNATERHHIGDFRRNQAPIARILNFDELDGKGDEDAPESGTAYSEGDDDIFYDTLTFPEGEDADDSLLGLAEKFAGLSVMSPPRRQNEVEEEEEEDSFETPPSTPPPVFVMDEEPCKIDNDLYEVLSKIPVETLSKFPMIAQYVKKVGKLDDSVRCKWPGIDSPYRSKFRKRL
ncbi:unnamed protein product [Caenorhabditis bovis]|uniref:ANKLE2 third alpha/beta domain-containing protein n=1 Tax=Caenorhabditis bovis TaxID=2654633 RepID=A0A8S1F010_9PELO|nr:unnamed protein product [Caenorhabditis bovis]